MIQAAPPIDLLQSSPWPATLIKHKSKYLVSQVFQYFKGISAHEYFKNFQVQKFQVLECDIQEAIFGAEESFSSGLQDFS